MGKIDSASTVYATAYLTEKGRKYLFNQGNIRFDSSGNDLLEILYFTLSDVDTNYQTVDVLILSDPLYATNAPGDVLTLDTDSLTTFPTATDAPPAAPITSVPSRTVGGTLGPASSI